MTNKFCVDCRFYKSHGKWGSDCVNPLLKATSPVYGEYIPQVSPEGCRASDALCGERGDWFEEKRGFFSFWRNR